MLRCAGRAHVDVLCRSRRRGALRCRCSSTRPVSSAYSARAFVRSALAAPGKFASVNIAFAGSLVVSTPRVICGTMFWFFIQPLVRVNDSPNCSECFPTSQLTVLSRFQLLPLRLECVRLVVAPVSADADVGKHDVEARLIDELLRGHGVGEVDRRIRDAEAQLVDDVLADGRSQGGRAAADGAVQFRGVRQPREVRIVAAEKVRRQPLSLIAVARAQPVRGAEVEVQPHASVRCRCAATRAATGSPARSGRSDRSRRRSSSSPPGSCARRAPIVGSTVEVWPFRGRQLEQVHLPLCAAHRVPGRCPAPPAGSGCRASACCSAGSGAAPC